MAENFTCSALDLSRENATELVWALQAEDAAHRGSVKSLAAVQIIFLMVGIPWNFLIIGVILANKLFYRPTHLLLLNLALSDLLVCVCVMPFNVMIALAGRLFIGSTDYVRCHICHFIVITIIVMIYLSLFTVALMAVDRLIYIKVPLKYSTIVTVKRMLLLLLVVWLLCILIGLPPVFGLGEIHYSSIVGSCSFIFSAQTRITKSIYYNILLVFVAMVPFVVTLVANIWFIYIIRRILRKTYDKNMNNVQGYTSQTQSEQIFSEETIKSEFHKQQIRVAQVFGAIFIANIITWIPTIVIALITASVGSENVPPETFSFVYLAFLSQPAIHPILETVLVPKVRSMFLRCVCWCRRRGNEEISINVDHQKLKIRAAKASIHFA